MSRSKNGRRETKARNFVAKHAQETGAGRHKDRKSDYLRQPKHRNQQNKEIL